jgi:hypothetical protein
VGFFAGHAEEDGAQVVTWNKEQAELLRRIALAGGSCAADECELTALQALINADFVRQRAGGRVALTDAGLARARELRSSPF